jgi:hypothetical protein
VGHTRGDIISDRDKEFDSSCHRREALRGKRGRVSNESTRLYAESVIVKHARRNGHLIRPLNHQAITMAEFPWRIAQILLRALWEVTPLR